jgi:hypothetical protein
LRAAADHQRLGIINAEKLLVLGKQNGGKYSCSFNAARQRLCINGLFFGQSETV